MAKFNPPKVKGRHRWLMWIRRRLYKAGIRPRPGSIFYSPSYDMLYYWNTVMNGFNGIYKNKGEN